MEVGDSSMHGQSKEVIKSYLLLHLSLPPVMVGGSILAAKLAMEQGWAIIIDGGFHHCSADKGVFLGLAIGELKGDEAIIEGKGAKDEHGGKNRASTWILQDDLCRRNTREGEETHPSSLYKRIDPSSSSIQ